MRTNDERQSCEKCQKAVKSTETALVCGLWCRKSFHNDCVGLNRSESSVLSCSNERIKFHCENCENRLAIELYGGKETHETIKLQNCLNNCLLALVEKILKLTNELSNDNLVINKKLDTVISSNTRLEEFILKSPKCLEIRTEESTDNSVESVENFFATRQIKIEENNHTGLYNTNPNSASMPQKTDDNSSPLHIAIDVSKTLSDNQESLVTEECNSNCVQEWEMHDDHSITQDLPSIKKEECVPLEDLIPRASTTVKTEDEGGKEKAGTEINKEGYSPSKDCLDCSTFSIEKTEHSVDGEAVMEDNLEELTHEVASASSDNEPESAIAIGIEEHRNKDDSNSFITTILQKARESQSFCCTTKQEVPCANNKTFKHKATLKKHWQLHSGIRLYSCSVCQKTFKYKSMLEQHFRVHTGERPFCCSVCNKTFTQGGTLKKHLMLHSGERPFSCTVCNKAFAQKITLMEHIMLHSDERPFRCDVCNKTFRNRSYLYTHSRMHSSERPFMCNICNKTFTQQITLKRHSMSHTGERPCWCNVCNKTFRNKGNLYIHSQTHSGERPFLCNVCNKTFTQKSTLKRHCMLHTGERPFRCNVCNKTFRCRSSLQQHSQLHSAES